MVNNGITRAHTNALPGRLWTLVASTARAKIDVISDTCHYHCCKGNSDGTRDACTLKNNILSWKFQRTVPKTHGGGGPTWTDESSESLICGTTKKMGVLALTIFLFPDAMVQQNTLNLSAQDLCLIISSWYCLRDRENIMETGSRNLGHGS
jgi:hypothetical protein